MYKNIKSINDLLQKYSGLDITSEMKNHFNKRTNKHIDLVKKYCKKIYDIFGDRFEGIIERGEDHDASKFKDPEIEPYILMSWDYKCKDDGVDSGLTVEQRNEMNEATEHHINNNSHHPEFHSDTTGIINREDRDAIPDKVINATKMEDLDIAEMCADWCAMSEEKGNTPQAWANKNINKRWEFTSDQEKLIYKLLNALWK